MPEVVSQWPLTMEPVQSRSSLRRICGGQYGTGMGFSLSALVFPYYSLSPLLHAKSSIADTA
jgi:hypothetical protein